MLEKLGYAKDIKITSHTESGRALECSGTTRRGCTSIIALPSVGYWVS